MTSRSFPELGIYIVDDDAPMRDSLSLMLGVLGYRTACFNSAEALLEAYRDYWAGCVIADLRLPGRSGLELQRELSARGSRMPFIVITAHGNVASARAAFLGQAVDFLEKPFEEADLRRAIDRSFDQESRRISLGETQQARDSKLAKLTGREREVLRLLAEGLHAREVGASLGISVRTVEVYKANLMSKLGARNTAGLVRYALELAMEGKERKDK
jgi:FixJ family two-component response regulator